MAGLVIKSCPTTHYGDVGLAYVNAFGSLFGFGGISCVETGNNFVGNVERGVEV